MNEPQKRTRGPRKVMDFDKEIAEAEAKLKSLIAAKKAQSRSDAKQRQMSKKAQPEERRSDAS